MKKILILGLVSLLWGCVNTKTETSEMLYEKATVVTLIYSPSQHNIDLTPTSGMGMNDDNIIGTDWNGNTGIKISDNYQITSTTIPEKYGVVFQCQHGTFTIEGSETKHKVLYDKLRQNVGDTVKILYKEQYYVTYEEKDGVTKETKRELNKLDFIDAQVK